MSNLIIGIGIGVGVAAVAVAAIMVVRRRRAPKVVAVVPDRRDRPCPRCQYTLGYKAAPCRKCRIYPQPEQA